MLKCFGFIDQLWYFLQEMNIREKSVQSAILLRIYYGYQYSSLASQGAPKLHQMISLETLVGWKTWLFISTFEVLSNSLAISFFNNDWRKKSQDFWLASLAAKCALLFNHIGNFRLANMCKCKAFLMNWALW